MCLQMFGFFLFIILLGVCSDSWIYGIYLFLKNLFLTHSLFVGVYLCMSLSLSLSSLSIRLQLHKYYIISFCPICLFSSFSYSESFCSSCFSLYFFLESTVFQLIIFSSVGTYLFLNLSFVFWHLTYYLSYFSIFGLILLKYIFWFSGKILQLLPIELNILIKVILKSVPQKSNIWVICESVSIVNSSCFHFFLCLVNFDWMLDITHEKLWI